MNNTLKFLKRISLGHIIPWVISIIVGVSLTWFAFFEKDILLKRETANLEIAAKALANYVSRSIIEADRTIVSSQQLMLSDFTSSPEKSNIEDHLKVIVNTSAEVLGVGLYDTYGEKIHVTEYLNTFQVSNFIKSIQQKHEETWANPLVHTTKDVEGAILDDELIVSRVLFSPNGQNLGVGIAVLSLEETESKFYISPLEINTKLDVVDINNKSILSIRSSSNQQFVSEFELGKLSPYENIYLKENDPILFSRVEANNYPLSGIAQIHQDDILSLWKKRVILYFSIGLISVLLITVIAVLSRKIKNAERLRRQELERLAHTDELTGAYNRRHFLKTANIEFSRSKRYGSHFTIMMLDIDFFKMVNDKYGHDIGDEALIQTVSAIQSVLRSEDTLSRFGGEEFIILLPETKLETTRIVAERISTAVAQIKISNPIDDLSLTISGGFSEILPSDEGIEPIIKRADKALYWAKQTGRNMIIHHSEATAS